MSDLIETTPRMELVSQDLEHLVEALRDNHALDRALLPRRAPREAAPTALQGLLAEGPHKSMAPLVRAVEGVPPHAVRAMQAVSREGTGDDEALLRPPWQAVEQDLGACADGPHTTRGWGERPAPHVPLWRGRGHRPPRERLVAGAPATRTMGEVAAARPAEAWARQTSQAGRQGPRVAACAAMRVVAVRATLPGPDSCWVRRRHRATGALKT